MKLNVEFQFSTPNSLRAAVVGLPSTNRAICGRLMRLFYAISENAEFTGQDASALGG